MFRSNWRITYSTSRCVRASRGLGILWPLFQSCPIRRELKKIWHRFTYQYIFSIAEWNGQFFLVKVKKKRKIGYSVTKIYTHIPHHKAWLIENEQDLPLHYRGRTMRRLRHSFPILFGSSSYGSLLIGEVICYIGDWISSPFMSQIVQTTWKRLG